MNKKQVEERMAEFAGICQNVDKEAYE